MTSGLGSISLSGLLGGTAGQIDTTSLINSLMQAQAIPQNQLKDQVTSQQTVITNYQGINSLLSTLASAAQAVTDPTSWAVTSATSSNTAVVASTSTGATAGSTTFTVAALAQAQVSTVAADANGNVVATPANGITITDAAGTAHPISLTSGSATDVAAAINQAGVGVRAAVITTDTGQVLQLSAPTSGTKSAFTASGFITTGGLAQAIVPAADAQVTVGNPSAGGYTISSQTNTFTNAIPGVTFSIGAGAVGQPVTITVAQDTDKITSTVQAMITAANAAKSGISQVTGQGGILQGYSDVTSIGSDLSSAISMGAPGGKSLSDYGIDIDSKGVISFNAGTFAAAYAADPTGTMSAVSGSLGATLSQIATTASAPTTGTLSQTISTMNDHVADLNSQIAAWGDRLNTIQTQLTMKYTAMQTALAKLQSEGTWLTSMFKSLQGNNSGSSSGSGG